MFFSPGVCCALPPEISSSPSSLLSLSFLFARQFNLFSFSLLFLFSFLSLFLLSFPSLLPSLSLPTPLLVLFLAVWLSLPRLPPLIHSSSWPSLIPSPFPSPCVSLFPAGCDFAWNNRKIGFLRPLRPRGRLRQSRRWWTSANFSATIRFLIVPTDYPVIPFDPSPELT